ncbi:cardiolipin synthetase 2 [Tepidimicrobium xylanilyticum]|uniref:Cardiolipin synthase n=2 Tax=Tepidimicrobium xylanilyticum TaxID=1123352 RepID=A0A1H2V8T3_9FIRM|nr:cardiolipin synthetase 2 [Tepidimicrobium xylanilyticum]
MGDSMEYIIDGYTWLFTNILWINILFAILLVFFERRNPTTTWLWLMVLTFLPGIGFLLYLFIGQDMSKKKMFKIKEKEDKGIRERVLRQGQKMVEDEYKFSNPRFLEYDDIIKMHILTSESFFSEDNYIEFYFSGQEKFEALLESIENAKKYIYLEYYIMKSDGIGTKLIDKLTQKAKEGVEVKVLYDGMGGRKLRKDCFDALKKAGGEVAVFFPPFAPYVTPRINYRNHRKICIIDGKEAFIGGFNIGDEYLSLSKKFGYWRDTHIKIIGTAVEDLQWRFFKDWVFAAKKYNIQWNMELSERPKKGKAGIQIVSSGPDSKWASVKDGYFKMIANARERIYIQTPYFIPDDSIFEALRVAGLSGIDVKVMIPCKPDHPFVYWAGLSYIGELLEAGVRFYTYQNGFLHCKTFIMDDFVTSIGTANLDIRSFKLNFEVNAFIYDEDANRKMVEQFNKDLEHCREITKEEYAQRSNIVKIKESISRLLSPIL